MRYEHTKTVYIHINEKKICEKLNTRMQWNSLCPNLLHAKYTYGCSSSMQDHTHTGVVSEMLFECKFWSRFFFNENGIFTLFFWCLHLQVNTKWNALRFYCTCAQEMDKKNGFEAKNRLSTNEKWICKSKQWTKIKEQMKMKPLKKNECYTTATKLHILNGYIIMKGWT